MHIVTAARGAHRRDARAPLSESPHRPPLPAAPKTCRPLWQFEIPSGQHETVAGRCRSGIELRT
jgi:hypothetical protein